MAAANRYAGLDRHLMIVSNGATRRIPGSDAAIAERARVRRCQAVAGRWSHSALAAQLDMVALQARAVAQAPDRQHYRRSATPRQFEEPGAEGAAACRRGHSTGRSPRAPRRERMERPWSWSRRRAAVRRDSGRPGHPMHRARCGFRLRCARRRANQTRRRPRVTGWRRRRWQRRSGRCPGRSWRWRCGPPSAVSGRSGQLS